MFLCDCVCVVRLLGLVDCIGTDARKTNLIECVFECKCICGEVFIVTLDFCFSFH